MSDTTTVMAPTPLALDVQVPDFELECCVGEGAFGQVYLARSKATGRRRAVKVVRRSRFRSDHPYEIEFAGLKRFEEISREHEGFVDILHVSRNDQAGYFCYVMELADDLDATRPEHAAGYVPRTLANELERRGRLPPAESVRVALALTEALAALHGRGLVHRDINPRNIIFVRGAPKLADVGLVAEAQLRPDTLIGTPDYMDVEVHGTPEGDLFSLGMVVYTMTTGLDPKQWPHVPDTLPSGPELVVFRELEAVWRKACQPHHGRRYVGTAELRQELLALRAGASVLRLKRFERTVKWFRRYGLAVAAVLASLAAGYYFHTRAQRQAIELQQRKLGGFVTRGELALNQADYPGALAWFGEAWRRDTSSRDDLSHRIRLGSIRDRAPRLEQLWFASRPGGQKEAYFPDEPNQVVMAGPDRQWRVYDLWKDPLEAAYPRPFGNGLPSERIALSHATKQAVSSAGTHQVWLWNYREGTRLATFDAPGATNLTSAAISPDGRWVAAFAQTQENAHRFLVWESAAPGEAPRVLDWQPVERHPVTLAFSPDSRLLLLGVAGEARTCEVATGRPVSQFIGHGSWIFNGAFSPDSHLVVTASWDRSARVWTADTAQEIARFMHDDAVWAAEFTANGGSVITAGLDSTARVWDLRSRTVTQFLRHNAKVLRASYGPQDLSLLTVCADDTVRVWQAPTPPAPARFEGLLTAHGTRLLSVTNEVWSVSDRAGRRPITLGVSAVAQPTFAFAADDRAVVATASTSSEGEPAAWLRAFDLDRTADPAVGAPIQIPATWGGVSNLTTTISARGQWVSAFTSRTGGVWSARSGKLVLPMTADAGRVSFSPDARLGAIARSNRVEVWEFDLEVEDARRLAEFWVRTNARVASLAWDATGRRLITAATSSSFDALEAETWIARTGRADGPALRHRDGVLYAAFSHDGTRAVTCGEDFMAILWDPRTGRQAAPSLHHRHQVTYATFSADDRLLATASWDNVVTIWDAGTGERLTWLGMALQYDVELPWLGFTRTARTPGLPDGLVVRVGGTHSYFWRLPYYAGQPSELLDVAQLLSAHRVDDAGGLIPLTVEELREAWKRRPRTVNEARPSTP